MRQYICSLILIISLVCSCKGTVTPPEKSTLTISWQCTGIFPADGSVIKVEPEAALPNATVFLRLRFVEEIGETTCTWFKEGTKIEGEAGEGITITSPKAGSVRYDVLVCDRKGSFLGSVSILLSVH
jgi:hypothetical protein